MQIENEVKLDFKDVLIRPQLSTLKSRSEVDISRTFKFKHTGFEWTGVPIVAANMDSTGTFEMFDALSKHQVMTALHKHYDKELLVDHFMAYIDPKWAELAADFMAKDDVKFIDDTLAPLKQFTNTSNSKYTFYSMGITDADYQKFKDVMAEVAEKSSLNKIKDDRFGPDEMHPFPAVHPKHVYHPIKMVCVDVANGYTDNFINFIKKLRQEYPNLVIMAGNVVTGDLTQELIRAGADIVKVGIGPGSVCTTRKMTGVGYPQLSAIIECANIAHGLGGLICADGGCTNPGDVSKAFGAGADFVMLGGMLAGHTESGGELVEENGEKFKVFYGMSSDTAMNKHSGGVANYKASEGKTVKIKYRGDVEATIRDILGGVRSTCSYVGASKLKELSKRTTFVRVTQQINEVFGKS